MYINTIYTYIIYCELDRKGCSCRWETSGFTHFPFRSFEAKPSVIFNARWAPPDTSTDQLVPKYHQVMSCNFNQLSQDWLMSQIEILAILS